MGARHPPADRAQGRGTIARDDQCGTYPSADHEPDGRVDDSSGGSTDVNAAERKKCYKRVSDSIQRTGSVVRGVAWMPPCHRWDPGGNRVSPESRRTRALERFGRCIKGLNDAQMLRHGVFA